MKKESISKTIAEIQKINGQAKEEDKVNIWLTLHPKYLYDDNGDGICPNGTEYPYDKVVFEYLEDGFIVRESIIEDEGTENERETFHIHFWPYKAILAITTEY